MKARKSYLVSPFCFVFLLLGCSYQGACKEASTTPGPDNQTTIRNDKVDLNLAHEAGELLATLSTENSHKAVKGLLKEEALFGDIDPLSVELLTPSYFEKTGTKETYDLMHVAYLVKLRNQSDEVLSSTIKTLRDTNLFEDVSPNHILYGSAVAKGQPYDDAQWGMNAINVEEAWKNFTEGSYSTRIGVLDSGVKAHPNLNIDYDAGRDFTWSTNSGTVDHGTMVAGIIGANGKDIPDENHNRIAGVCKKSTIVDLRIAKEESYYEDGIRYVKAVTDGSIVTKAVNYLVSLWGQSDEVQIINFSYSGYASYYYAKNDDDVDLIPPSDPEVPTVSEYFNSVFLAFRSFPGLVVWSAGNQDRPLEDNDCRFSSNIIGVGATNSNGQICSFSNWGTAVHVYAPGEAILSTNNENNCRSGNGTSFAAPFVAGTAGLIRSMYPGLTSRQIKESIINSVDYEEAWHTGSQVFEPIKKLNVNAALEYAETVNAATNENPIHLEMLSETSNNYNFFIKNTGSKPINIAYRSTMCEESQIETFARDDCKTTYVSPSKGKTLTIKKDGAKKYFSTCFYDSGKKVRKVVYIYRNTWDTWSQEHYPLFTEGSSNLNEGLYCNNASKGDNVPALKFTVTDSRINWFVRDWKITIKNNVSEEIKVTYNSKMCFFDDGYNWSNLKDNKTVKIGGYSESNSIWIGANGTADSIAMYFEFVDKYGFKYRLITVANKIGSYTTYSGSTNLIKY